MSFENKPNDKKFARKDGDKKREFVKKDFKKDSDKSLTKSLIRELQSTSMFHTPVSQHSSCVWCTPF